MDAQHISRNINELLVLGALRSGPLHGYQIALDVESASDGHFTLQHGTLYPLLHRLENGGLLRGRWTNAGGRRRREYTLTAQGRRHLGQEADQLRRTLQRLERIIGDPGHGALRPHPAAG